MFLEVKTLEGTGGKTPFNLIIRMKTFKNAVFPSNKREKLHNIATVSTPFLYIRVGKGFLVVLWW